MASKAFPPFFIISSMAPTLDASSLAETTAAEIFLDLFSHLKKTN